MRQHRGVIGALVALSCSVLAGIALAGCGGGGGAGGGGGELIIDLEEQSGSGQFGSATLTAEGDKTQVLVETESPFGRDAQPAHIHRGTCANLDPTPAYPLPNLTDGLSGTTIDVSLDELREGEFAINVHRSVDKPDVYTACGNIQ